MEQELKKANLEAALQLLEKARLSADEVSSRLDRALSPAYWEALNPQLSVNRDINCCGFEVATIEALRQRELLAKLSKEGYFQIEPLISTSVIERMRASIEALKRVDWPPVFAFVYDEFWQVARLPALVQLLSAHLGPGYRQVPHIWGHYVHPQGGAGWQPHIDSYHQSRRLTVWIALSEAALTGSCMFLIPKNLAPRNLADNFIELETVSKSDLMSLLKNSRPLPVHAGSLLGWEHNVIHWGASAWQTTEPRISISMEFIQENLSPDADERPLLDAHDLPTFPQRLLVIGQAIAAYQKFEPLQIRYLDLAQRLLAEHVGLIEPADSKQNV